MAKRNSKVLSDVQLRHWIAEGAPVAKSDGDGLTFTLSSAGAASWIFRFSHGGRRHELTLGSYPDLSLTAARKLAAARRVEVQQGINPAAQKRKDKSRKSWSVRQLAANYRELALPTLSASTQRSYERNLKRIEAAIGAMPVAEVASRDVVAVIERNNALGWVEARMLLVTLKVLFRHAAGRKLIDANPCSGVELSALRGERPEPKKRLMLTAAEIHAVMTAQMSRENALAVRILLATGVRVSELYTAQWQHVDLAAGNWHLPKSKTGPEMDIPLAPAVVEWFRELQVLAGDSAFVLPARRLSNGDGHISKDTLAAAISFWLNEHKPEVRRFTPHDLRSTLRSHMKPLGIGRDVAEMLLNHKLQGIEGIYDRHTYYEERRAALELWASFLTNCETGASWNVKRLRKAA